MTSAIQTLTLEAFLHLPNIEESPAWEFIDGEMLQKPMPTTHHSILPKRLVAAIDQAQSQYEAFPPVALCAESTVGSPRCGCDSKPACTFRK